MTTATPEIRPLTADDFELWQTLWHDYLRFYNTDLPAETTVVTWRKILDTDSAIFGFGAWQDNRLVGIVHTVLHPNTWNTTDCCYLEDLFVTDALRGQGVGRALIHHVYDFAEKQGCNRVYWVTQADNLPARQLYERVANQTEMVQYRKDL